jgi:hypothetical protein
MRNRTLAVISTAIAIPLVALALGLTGAEATRTVRIASHITIKSKSLTFSGNVTSPNAACKRLRKVTLYRASALALGTTTTGPSGHWTITASGSAGISLGRFYAKVATRSEGTAGTIYVCKAARSKTIRLKP